MNEIYFTMNYIYGRMFTAFISRLSPDLISIIPNEWANIVGNQWLFGCENSH